MECLVVVAKTDRGIRNEWRGMNYGCYGLEDLGKFEYDEDQGNDTALRVLKVWACQQEDVHVVVDKVSAQWVGHEVKVYELKQIATRLAGEMKTKEVSNDGVLPA